MPLDPQARRLLDAIARLQLPPISTLTPQAAKELSAALSKSIPIGPDAEVVERELPGPRCAIPVRIYRPLGNDSALPAVVYLHGGGFVIGNVEQSDAVCRWLATNVPCVVINVEYPLAPEHTFPVGLEHAYLAVQWVCEHASELNICPERIAVAGDSAGANLATVLTMLARDRGGPDIAYQVLLYPVTDLSNFDTASYLINAEGLYLTRETMLWFAAQYLPEPGDALHEHASPLLAKNLRDLPPALVITAEFDPLCDEGEAYARRLESAGVPTRLSRYDGMIHGFTTMNAHLDAGKRALEETALVLRGVFGSESTSREGGKN